MAGHGRSSTKTPRERYRAQVRAEIKERAWEQIATAGASALSLNAIAKQMGMSGPGSLPVLRRPRRADHRTHQGRVPQPRRHLPRGARRLGPDLTALAHALRRWALEDPQRYFLVYGTPVPGYHAPQDITAIASEIMTTLLDACTAAGPEEAPTGADAASTPTSRTTGTGPPTTRPLDPPPSTAP